MNRPALLLFVVLPCWQFLMDDRAAASATERLLPETIAVADLKDQLEKGLKARRPVEFEFIANVVTLVENDRLPVVLVKGIFRWAVQRGELIGHPYRYFEQAMRRRAAEVGVSIP